MGVIPNKPNQSLTTFSLPSHIQKVVVLNICSTVRKFLSDGVYLPEEADNH